MTGTGMTGGNRTIMAYAAVAYAVFAAAYTRRVPAIIPGRARPAGG